jgi:hypothetical protein
MVVKCRCRKRVGLTEFAAPMALLREVAAPMALRLTRFRRLILNELVVHFPRVSLYPVML